MAARARAGRRDRFSRLSLIAGVAALLWVSGFLACDQTPTPAWADSPSPRPAAAEESPTVAKPGHTPTRTTPSPIPVATVTARATPDRIVEDRIVDVIANKAAYPVPLAGAAKRFASIAALARETPAPEVTLMVGSGPGVSRMEVGYAEDAAGKTTFSHVLMLLLPTPPRSVPVSGLP